MTSYDSKKVAVMRLAAVLSVLWFHAYYPVYVALPAGSGLPTSFSATEAGPRIWSLALMRWALPFLGCLSGYLFFRGFTPSAAAFVAKYRRRVWSLLVPFLLWSGFGVVYVLAAQSFVADRASHAVTVDSFAAAISLWLIRPAMSQLWFLQALMGCVVLAPLVYLCIRWSRGWFVLVGVVWWLSGWPSRLDIPWLSPTVFFPFTIGASIAILGWRMPRLPRWVAPPWIALWLAACAVYGLAGIGSTVSGRAPACWPSSSSVFPSRGAASTSPLLSCVAGDG